MTAGQARAQRFVELTLELMENGATIEDAIAIARRVGSSDARRFFVDDNEDPRHANGGAP